MNAFVMAAILAVTLAGYLSESGILPGPAKLLPEALSAIVLLLVVVLGARQRFREVRPVYWFAFTAMGLVMVCGIFANSVDSGPVIAGLRGYLRAVPFFFLPAVYPFSERQVRSQLRLLIAICIVQLPLAVSQRATAMMWNNPSGDEVAGTLQTSGLLSIFLICAACLLTAAVMRKRMPWTIFLPLFVLLLVPTMINETKVTLILLPVGLMTVFIGNSPPGARLKNAIASVFLTTVFAAIFIPSYDYYIAQRKYGTPIMEFFTSEEKFDRYMGQSAALGTHDVKQVGRMDALTTPSREISRNATHFVFGLGIGNASRSSLGPDFTGQYFRDFGPFIQSAASLFILETGFLGLGIALIMNFLIFRDARVVSDLDSGLIGVIAAGWSGTAAVIGLATFYANIVGSEAISYMFWFFSGLIAAHRVRLSRGLA